MPIEASAVSGLTKSGMRRLPAGLEVRVLGEDGEVRVEDTFEGEHLLGQPLVLPQIELAGAAAGVAEAEQIQTPATAESPLT